MRTECDSLSPLSASYIFIVLHHRLLLHCELRTKSFDSDTLEGSIRSNSNDITGTILRRCALLPRLSKE